MNAISLLKFGFSNNESPVKIIWIALLYPSYNFIFGKPLEANEALVFCVTHAKQIASAGQSAFTLMKTKMYW